MTSVTIEVAHVTLLDSGLPATRAIERSCIVGGLLFGALEDVGITPTVGVLIDDKQVTTATTKLHTIDLVQIVQRYLPVTYACSERVLGVYRDSLLSLLDDEDLQRRRQDYLDERLARFGALPCSVDIAIWHLLRLGEIVDRESVLLSLDATTPVAPAEVVISVLPENLSDPERIADRDWLRHLDGGTPLERVKRVYFPVSRYYEWSSAAARAEVVALANEIATRQTLMPTLALSQ